MKKFFQNFCLIKNLRIFNIQKIFQIFCLIKFSWGKFNMKNREIFIIIVILISVLSLNFVCAASNSSAFISINTNWDSDKIVNGQEFSIEVSASGLLDKDYDVKVYILDENGKMISQTENEEGKWITSIAFIAQLQREN